MEIKRDFYLNKLIGHKKNGMVKIITGVRRCGKSVLMQLYAEELLASGVDRSRIISINFEDFDYHDLRDPQTLYNYVNDRLQAGGMNYVFLDEIQHVGDYADVVDALYIKENVDLYITGSNA